MNGKTITAMLLATIALAFTSCVDDDSFDNQHEEKSFSLHLALNDMQGTRSVSETSVDSLAVLLFDASTGNIVSSTTRRSVTLPADINIPFSFNNSHDMAVFAVANYSLAALSSVATISQLKALTMSISSAADIADGDNMVMTASDTIAYKADLSQVHDTLHLNRSVAKITVNLTSNATNHVYLYSCRLCHAPSSSYIYSADSGTGYLDFDDVRMTDWYATSYSADYYVFMNNPGNGTAASYAARTFDNSPSGATYLEVRVRHLSSIYTNRIYIGGTTPADYSIVGNRNYTYNIAINGTTEQDVRVYGPTISIDPDNNVYPDWVDSKKMLF